MVPFAFEGQQRGGWSRLAGLVQQLRDQHPGAVLWLDGGDTWHGTNLANLFQGQSVVEVMNTAGVSAMVVGNHDFNYGGEALLQRVQEARFPVLSANILQEASGQGLLDPVAFFEVNGLRLAVLGLTTPDTAVKTLPAHVEGLAFLDPVEVASRWVPRLREEADLVVVLSHLGVEVDRELAARVPGIDVIVGGHSHTVLEKPIRVDETLVVQAGEYGKYLGVLRLQVAQRPDGEGGSRVLGYEGYLIPVDAEIPGDPEIEAVIASWEARLPAILDRPVGYASVRLVGDREAVRTQETNLGNLVADIYRQVAGADIALINSGSIRDSVDPGVITLREIYQVLPFDNSIIGLRIKGRQLRQALEHGLTGYPQPWGGFPQVSGLRLIFDPEAPPGSRLREVFVGDKPLDDEREYKLATNDFLATGGDGYTMLTGLPIYFGSLRDGAIINQVVAEYLLEVDNVAPRVEGRIRPVTSAE